MLWREGAELTLRLTPAERQEIRPRETEFKPCGLTVRDISWLVAHELHRDSTNGALVTSVRPGGPAGEAKPNLEPRDVVLAVEDRAIKSVADLAEVTRELMAGKKERLPVLVRFDRGDREYLSVVKLGVQELQDPGLEATKGWLPVDAEVISRDVAAHLGKPTLKGFYVTQMKRWRNDDFEFTVRDIAFHDRVDEQWPAHQAGVLVEDVRPGGWAELGMLYPSDLILEIDGRLVGIFVMRSLKPSGSGGLFSMASGNLGITPIILPADTVQRVARQVPAAKP